MRNALFEISFVYAYLTVSGAQSPVCSLRIQYVESVGFIDAHNLFEFNVRFTFSESKRARLLHVAHARTYIKFVFPFLENVCGSVARDSAVVEGSESVFVECKFAYFPFSGAKLRSFTESDEVHKRFTEPALRGTAIDLNDLFTRNVTGILYARFNGDFTVLIFKAARFDFERSITQTEAERIKDFLGREGLEITVSDVNILGVVIEFPVAEIGGRRIIGVISRDGHRKLSGRRAHAVKDVRNGGARSFAELPHVHDRGKFVAVLLRPRHVYHIAAVHQDHGMPEYRSHRVEHIFFRLRKIIAPFLQDVLAVFARGSAYHDHRGIGGFTRLRHKFRSKRHFVEIVRPVSPVSVIRFVSGKREPVGVRLLQRLVNLDA